MSSDDYEKKVDITPLMIIIPLITFIALLLMVFSVQSIDIEDSVSQSLTDTSLNIDGTVDVAVQDQTTRLFTIPVNRILNNNLSLASVPVVDSYELTLVDASLLSVGDKISFLEQNGAEQIYFGNVMSISGNVITMNDPVPFPFTPSKTVIFSFDNQLNVDGSVNPVIFSLINVFDQSVDITRIIFSCTDDTIMDAGLFCGDTALSRGVLFRKKTVNDHYINYFNVRNNAKWANLAYDVSYIDNGKPPNDVYGFSTRLTFAGSNKIGVVIRLSPGESIELVVQDDLTDVSGASLMVEGHFTDE